ncbi:unnamed protein product [Ceratitis capitata]|uniref:(Mediterranean fruit fly) hypothetical protein n=1 Tax=Ceratitis capitata TaxID=7213 RepID=A0A811VCD5_CERCA|nr:unnamed protein product [Ceratitis capitata]
MPQIIIDGQPTPTLHTLAFRGAHSAQNQYEPKIKRTDQQSALNKTITKGYKSTDHKHRKPTPDLSHCKQMFRHYQHLLQQCEMHPNRI